jgi:hypothetical protein
MIRTLYVAAAIALALGLSPAQAQLFGRGGLIGGTVGQVLAPVEKAITQLPSVAKPAPPDSGPRSPCNPNPNACIK